jgi:L-lysine 2,3-aminomutase
MDKIGRRMIAAEPQTRQTSSVADWQSELADAIRDPAELLRLLQLAPEQVEPGATLASLRAAATDFPLLVPRSFVAKMRLGDPRDPLLRQVLSLGAESLPVLGYMADPLAEQTAREAPGLLHKYDGRVLLITTGACAVHCRYCFRRHYDYAAEVSETLQPRWSEALTRIAQEPNVSEVILSGGDPLALSNARLAQLLSAIAAIGHVKRIRIHTRTPVVLPSRVDSGLLELLRPHHDKLCIVVHVNHAAEIDPVTTDALRKLAQCCTALLNQSVLLRSINDDVETLRQLSTTLFAAGVLPYYLHQLDAVAGAAHFAVADDHARALQRELAATMPGYLVPRLVREVPGARGKTPLGP